MADTSQGRASFGTQADALLRKNLTYQKRNMKTNIRLILFPFMLCLLLVVIQTLVNNLLDKPSNKCGCVCKEPSVNGNCEKVCGIQYSDLSQASSCAIPFPPEWPPSLQVPFSQYRAVRSDSLNYMDLPSESCRRNSSSSCPAAFLITGTNRTFEQSLAGQMFPTAPINGSDITYSFANNVLGTSTKTQFTNFIDPTFGSPLPLYRLQPQCGSNSTFPFQMETPIGKIPYEIHCVQSLPLWRNNYSEINNDLYKGFWKGNPERKINEITAAYDFSNTNFNHFNVTIWYNSSFKNDTGRGPLSLMRIPRSVNLASNAYLQAVAGSATKMLFEFIKEMPKPETQLRLDLASLIGALFFTWVILQLFPVVLTALVYEKEQNLRIMMKMHGLGDGPYWLITYAYFLAISTAYMLCFVIFGSVIGLKYFTLNSYSIQFVFYFIYINLQISLAFLVAAIFTSVKSASVIGYIMVFGSGLLGGFLFQFFLQDPSFSRSWILVMELYPGFSLYRGLYEFAQYAFTGNFMGTKGMRWKNLNDSDNGMKEVLVIMSVEWLVTLFVAYYIDQVVFVGKRPLFLIQRFLKKSASSSSFRRPSFGRMDPKVLVKMEQPDVSQERDIVAELLLEPTINHAIVCDNVKKVYPGRDGNPQKYAVRGLSLAIPQAECFGMLGPNGAGKTSFINMMIGLIKPSYGTAYVQGMDIKTSMDEIYSSMGVCPQHDLLWETLTGREHLLFYGRLKNLKGNVLTEAVEESLKSVNLFYGGVADKQAGKYSGGMKRRLSVAISLIGDPKVVYMDEPSTGLDPASRNSLWNVVKRAKQNRAIILTTHSMEEAEYLCDRLGIFVDGSLQCIGNPKELKARYGGSYVFTMTTSSSHEEEVEILVKNLSPSANKVYHLSGTQKFELPKQEVRIADVFRAVENAKSRFVVQAWGLADTTLEDVFIKVARGAQAFTTLS